MSGSNGQVWLRSRLRAGETLVGAWVQTPSAAYVEMASLAGVDFLVIDLEHGEIGLPELTGLIRAVRPGPTRVIARVPNHDPAMVCRVLDRGAHGVLVPRVEDASTAARLASAARYGPGGSRGVALGAVRASGYGAHADYRALADKEVLVAVQIESGRAVEQATAIAAAPGVDVAFLGPNDLCADLGIEGDDEAISRVLDGLVDDLLADGRLVGAVPYTTHTWQDWARRGLRLLVADSDVAALHRGISDLMGQRAGLAQACAPGRG